MVRIHHPPFFCRHGVGPTMHVSKVPTITILPSLQRNLGQFQLLGAISRWFRNKLCAGFRLMKNWPTCCDPKIIKDSPKILRKVRNGWNRWTAPRSLRINASERATQKLEIGNADSRFGVSNDINGTSISGSTHHSFCPVSAWAPSF